MNARAAVRCLAMVAVPLSLSAPHAAPGSCPGTELGPGPGGQPLYLWQAAESYPGGSQADVRLDRAVSFWGAGLPLRNVFSSVGDQTGVTLTFHPARDDNKRICVTLFLNADDPPTLRELMVQLSWVLDCPFALAIEDDGKYAYYLLSTSIAGGAFERVQRERHEAFVRVESGQEAWVQTDAEVRGQMCARLDDLREALQLTEKEAFARYRGKDDLLLLAALDPARRAIARFVFALSDEHRELMCNGPGFLPRLSRLSPDARKSVKELLGLALARKHEGPVLIPGYTEKADEHWHDWEWVEESDPLVTVYTHNPTGIELSLEPWCDPQDPDCVYRSRDRTLIRLGFLQLIPDPRGGPAIHPDTEVDLRRLLGEDITEKQAWDIRVNYWREDSLARQRQELETTLRQNAALSETAETSLGEAELAILPHADYALWQFQELLAVHTDFQVVSDCFAPYWRRFGEDLEALQRDGGARPSALLITKLMCGPRASRSSRVEVGDKGVEWGDAGDFLRFRTRERDVWRAAFLPQGICETLDEWLAPHLPEAPTDGGTGPAILVPIDDGDYFWLFRQLSPAQRKWGGDVIYSDTADPANGYRYAFREQLLRTMDWLAPILQILAQLSEDQWERIRDVGLVWGVDFSPPIGEQDRRRGFWFGRKEGDVLRILPAQIDELRQLYGGAVTIAISAASDAGRAGDGGSVGEVRAIMVYRDGEAVAGDALPRRLLIRPRNTAQTTAQKSDRSPSPSPAR